MVRPEEARSFEPSRIIDLTDERQVAYWLDRFKATPEELQQAIAQVGDNAVAVAIWMRAPDALADLHDTTG